MSEWISVEDRLPESEQEVLIYIDSDEYRIATMQIDGFDTSDGCFYEFDDVTHWMPLPEPPKEEKDA